MTRVSSFPPIPAPPTQMTVVVRSICSSTPEEREELLRRVEYNVFAFPASLVTCDFLSDSGTSAMTDVQWAALMRGDEAYGRNSGYYCILDAFRDIFERGDLQQRLFRDVLAGTADSPFYCNKFLEPHEGGFVNGGYIQLARPNFFLVPQGRCAETLLFATMKDMLPPLKGGKNHVIISNGFFDTTGANAAVAGFELQTFTQPGLRDSFDIKSIDIENPFKGNLDIIMTEAFLKEHHDRVALLLITITNNFAAAQPVSMANIQEASRLATKYGVSMFFDACRFAENARFIQEFEHGYSDCSILEIVRQMFSYVDGFTISLKKDGMANMGGALAIRDGSSFMVKFSGDGSGSSIGVRMKERQILCYGNDSYGGMSGRDLMAAAVGLYETTKETFLRTRIGQVRSFARKLHTAGVPVLLPPGGHAIYLDMDEFFADCGRGPDEFASVGFTLELLKKFGVRAAEAGPFAWEWDKKTTQEERDCIPNLIRFAVPRNTMSDHHIDYTVAAISRLHQDRFNIPGVKIIRGKELRIRHFHCGFAPIPVASCQTPRTFCGEARKQLTSLGVALKLDEVSVSRIVEKLNLSMDGWGNAPIPVFASGRLSNVGSDHSPVEYSVAIEHDTGKGELRFLVEAQPGTCDAGADSFLLSADRLTASIQKTYPETTNLARLQKIQDLFRTDKINLANSFAAWHSACVSSGKMNASWKIYLDPRVDGAENANTIIQEALNRLHLTQYFEALDRMMGPQDNFIYFALDLDVGQQARVKVYVQHVDATATDISRKLASLCPSVLKEDVQTFRKSMSGGSLGPYTAKPVVTCIAFTGNSEPEGTVHFPVLEYARDDQVIKRRIEEYHSNFAPAVLSGYQRSVEALQSRPLEKGRGLHSWVSLKRTKCRGPVTTFYLSAELYAMLPLGQIETTK